MRSYGNIGSKTLVFEPILPYDLIIRACCYSPKASMTTGLVKQKMKMP